MGWSSASQFKRLKSGDSFLGQGNLLVQGPQSFRIFLELLGISRTWLSLARGNMRQKSTELLQSQPPSFPEGWGGGRGRDPAIQGPPLVSACPGLTCTLPPPQIWRTIRAPNPNSSSSSSYFPACLPPILWPSHSQLPKTNQCLGVLCPERCCSLVWGQGASPEDTGAGLLGVLASRLRTGNGWRTDSVRGCLDISGRRRKSLRPVVEPVYTLE